jgi:hypothetical protein
MLDDKNFLAHVGKKGMKWGVRKDKRAKVGKRSYDARKLSNKELTAVVKRMELEQKYSQLNKKNLKKQTQGRKFVGEVLNASRSKTAAAIGAGAATFAISQALKNKTVQSQIKRFI